MKEHNEIPFIPLTNPHSIERAREEIAQRKPWRRYIDSEHEKKELLSVKEVAKLLGKSEKTIRRWADREHHPLPAIKLFCNEQYTWSFNRAEVLDWFNLFQQKQV